MMHRLPAEGGTEGATESSTEGTVVVCADFNHCAICVPDDDFLVCCPRHNTEAILRVGRGSNVAGLVDWIGACHGVIAHMG